MADQPINVNVNVSQSQSQGGGGCAGCLGVLGLLLFVGLIGKAFEASPVLGGFIVAVIAACVGVAVFGKIHAGQETKRAEAAERAAEASRRAAMARAAEVRAEIETRAAVDAVGGCGWCGHPEAHRGDNGHPVHPRDWHALDIEEAVKTADTSRPAPAPLSSVVIAPAPTPKPTPNPAAPPPIAPTPMPDVPVVKTRAPMNDLQAQLRYHESGECLWCGSPSMHRTEAGRVIHPARFHKDEYEAERALPEPRSSNG